MLSHSFNFLVMVGFAISTIGLLNSETSPPLLKFNKKSYILRIYFNARHLKFLGTAQLPT